MGETSSNITYTSVDHAFEVFRDLAKFIASQIEVDEDEATSYVSTKLQEVLAESGLATLALTPASTPASSRIGSSSEITGPNPAPSSLVSASNITSPTIDPSLTTPSSTPGSSTTSPACDTVGVGSGQKGKKKTKGKGRKKAEVVPNAKIRAKLQPDRPTMFKLYWAWCRLLLGPYQRPYDINSSDSEVKQLFNQYENELSDLDGLEAQKNSRLVRARLQAMRVAEIYEEERKSEYDKMVRDSPNPSRILPYDERQRLGKDTALAKLTRQIYDLSPSYTTNCDYKKKKSKVEYLIRIGRSFKGMVDELGWGAMIYPGLLLGQEEYHTIGIHQSADFIAYVKSCYMCWEQELRGISPIMEILIRHGLPNGFLLNIHSVPEAYDPERMDLNLSRWICWTIEGQGQLGCAEVAAPSQDVPGQPLAEANSHDQQQFTDGGSTKFTEHSTPTVDELLHDGNMLEASFSMRDDAMNLATPRINFEELFPMAP